MSEATALREAARLFNAAEYHEAHEVLDELWEGTHGPESDFYKGLIQAAICMYHFSRGNLDGARKLYRGHRRYLAGYLPRYRGLDVEGCLAQMQRCLQPVLRAAPDAAVPFVYDERPRLSLEDAPDGSDGSGGASVSDGLRKTR